jgi:transcriptional regulator with XRE-family HTH domain
MKQPWSKFSLNKKVQQIRILRHLTHKAMGTMLEITQAAYSNKESGATRFSYIDIMTIAHELRIDPCFFVQDMNIDIAVFENELYPLRKKIERQLQMLDGDQLKKISEFMNAL